MDERLESIDKLLESIDKLLDTVEDPRRELAFAILGIDENDPVTLNWLAVCAVELAAELSEG